MTSVARHKDDGSPGGRRFHPAQALHVQNDPVKHGLPDPAEKGAQELYKAGAVVGRNFIQGGVRASVQFRHVLASLLGIFLQEETKPIVSQDLFLELFSRL